MDDETVDQTEKDSQGGNKGVHDVEEGKPYPSDKINNSAHNSNSVIKTEHKRQLPVSSESDMLSTDVNAHSPPSDKTRRSPRGARYAVLLKYAHRISHYLVHVFMTPVVLFP